MAAPLFETPPQLVDEVSGTRAWFFDEVTTVVDQAVGPMTAAVAHFLTVTMERELQRRWVQAGKKVRYVHDWRSCVTYETEARERIISWGRASQRHTAGVLLQLAPDASPFIRIAAFTGISALKVLRMPIDLVDDLGPVLKELSAYTPR